MNRTPLLLLTLACLALPMGTAQARTRLVALPDRELTRVNLDNHGATLVEEERILTLQEGLNRIDFTWKGVAIDVDSIRLRILDHPDQTRLLNVSYPPGATGLVWEVHAPEARRERVRISYLLSSIDRLIRYQAMSGGQERHLDLDTYLVLRNFSGEDFRQADVALATGRNQTLSLADGESKRLLYSSDHGIEVHKVFRFHAGIQPWEPDKQAANVGIPVYYEFDNSIINKLGRRPLEAGKLRVYQDDGVGGRLFLGEDRIERTSVGQTARVYIGDSRDLVVTQRRQSQQRSNVRRNRKNRVILYDLEESMRVAIENFKDQPARIRIIEPMRGDWEIRASSHDYERRNAGELRFELSIPAHGRQLLKYQVLRRNLRAGG